MLLTNVEIDIWLLSQFTLQKVVMNIELPDEKMKQKAIKIVSDGKGKHTPIDL